MTGSFILDYYVLVFLASTGVFQVAAAFGGFSGLLYFKHRPGSIFLGLALLTGAFAWFFLSEPRNVPDSAYGMNGNEQFGYFFAGSGTGLAFTLIVSSLRNRSLGAGRSVLPAGLDALRESSYLRALYRTWTPLWPRRHRVPEANRGSSLAELPGLRDKSQGGSALRHGFVPPVAAGTRRAGFFRLLRRLWS